MQATATRLSMLKRWAQGLSLPLLLAVGALANHGGSDYRGPGDHLAPPDSLIRGSVRFAHDRSPISGVLVTLHGKGVELATRRSDADGHFEFRPGRADGARSISVAATAGIRFPTDRLSLVESKVEYGFEAEAVPTGKLNGLAVHALTNLPLERCQLRIKEEGGPLEVLYTDDRGRFLTQTEFAERQLEFRAWDPLVGSYARKQHSTQLTPGHIRATIPTRIEVLAGRRLELAWDPPRGMQPHDYYVEIRRPGQDAFHSGGALNRMGLHAGSPNWVRCLHKSPPREGQWLYLHSKIDERVWFAPIPPSLDAPIELQLLEFGRLAGRITEGIPSPRVTDRFGNSISKHVKAGLALQLERLSTTTAVNKRIFRRVPISKEFELPRLQTGRWRVKFSTSHYPSDEFEVVIRAGEVTRLERALGKPEELGDLVLRVIDECGDVPKTRGHGSEVDYSALITGLDRRSLHSVESWAMCGVGISTLFKRVDFQGRKILEARLEGVAKGRYRVKMSSMYREFDPPELIASTDSPATVFVCRPRFVGSYGVRGLLSGTHYQLLGLRGDQNSPWIPYPVEDGIHAYDLPESSSGEWCLRIEGGYQRQYGDRDDFEKIGGRYWIQARTRPGYAILAEACLSDGTAARNVPLEFDERVFRTDAQGRVLLRTPNACPALAISARDHRVIGGDLDANGGFDDQLPSLRLVVEPHEGR